MALNANFIRGITPVDAVGSIQRGNQAAAQTNALRTQNDLTNLYRTQGAGILAGDPNSLNALAGIDPMAAMGVKQQQHSYRINEEQLKISYENARLRGMELAATMDARTRQEEAAKLERGLAGAAFFYQKGDKAGYEAFLRQNNLDPASLPFEAFPAHAAGVKGAMDALTQFTPKTPTPTDDMREYEFAKSQGFTGTFQDYQTSMRRAGAATTNLNINGQPTPDPFGNTLAEAEANMFAEFIPAGAAASRNLARLDQLGALLDGLPTGFDAAARQRIGEFGVNVEGLSDIQAAQALINAMVPEQRQPGSGPMSDADLALFKQSLPRIINQPGGNRLIIETIRQINEYDRALGQIAAEAASGRISRDEARSRVQNIANPLEGFGQRITRLRETDGVREAPAAPTPAFLNDPRIKQMAQDGTPPEAIWENLSPAARARFAE